MLSILSLALAAALAVLRLVEFAQKQMEKRRIAILEEANAGPKRDALIVGGAEQAVMVLTQTLTAVNAELAALRLQLAQLEAENRAYRAREEGTTP